MRNQKSIITIIIIVIMLISRPAYWRCCRGSCIVQACATFTASPGLQDAMRSLFRVTRDLTGNLPPMPGVFPDYPAPIVRMTEGERELTMARWGMPSPVFALKGRTTDSGVTNVRNTASPHWRRWLGPANRCIVPFTSFSEYETGPESIGM